MRVTPSGTTESTYVGTFAGSIIDRTFIATWKLVHAEFTSKQGTSRPSFAAIVQASAGVTMSGAELPEITMPTSCAEIPARAIAISAARRPVSALPQTITSVAMRRSRFFVSRM